ncbi:hypothetical protein CF336_g8479 [Tilletia laevis]|nr:hypothetical protein CF336_g8479 [Tilletia laevis]
MAFDLSNEAAPGVGAASPSLSSDEDATASEFDSNFGDGIEPEHVLDHGRAILDSMEAEDDHGPDMPTSSLLTFASNHSQLDTALAASHAIPQRPYSSIVAAFEHALPLRDDHQHRLDAERYQRPFASKADKDLHERNTGARYSPLLQLSYWRSVSRSPVDYMHCLELGLAKRLFHRVLIVGEVITPAHLAIIQRGLQTCRVPSSEQAPDQRLGDPGGGSATAAHWSTLMRRLLPLLLFVAWRDIIVADDELDYVIKPVDTSARPDSDATHNTPEPATLLSLPSRSRVKKPRKRLRIARPVNARDVVRNVAQLAAATTLAARRSMSLPDVDQLDAILRDYGRTTAVLFGAAAIIYNLHLALHLPEHIRRFGPAYHFSAYHFERMNGQLGRTPTNRHRNGEIETTYTTAFVTSGKVVPGVDAELGFCGLRTPPTEGSAGGGARSSLSRNF